jgi:putative transposase
MKIFKSNNNVVYSCNYHVVWVTKYRKEYLEGAIEKRLKQVCKDVAKECNIEISEMECERDHIQLLVDVDPLFGIHKAVKRMKGISSRILRQEFEILRQRLPTLWTNSYFVCTVGGAPIAVVKQYIELQKERAKPKQTDSNELKGAAGDSSLFYTTGLSTQLAWGLSFLTA